MRTLRDFLGTPCPVCHQDILQRPPERARMPSAEAAWCAACESELTLADLTTRAKPGPMGFLQRLFKPKRTQA